ncbi:MAG: hypothetical protein EBZ77_00835 [Chitinophagia bacterium]|nr:hypothetical protein [Chitinophagia bacterium]
MKQATLLCTILLFPMMLLSQKSINLAGLKFQQYDKGGASTVLQFSSNTQATYIISGTSPIGGKSYRDECPCKCTVTGTSIEIVCNCADKDIYPDPIKDSFTYDAA